jgi:hypothetical protein
VFSQGDMNDEDEKGTIQTIEAIQTIQTIQTIHLPSPLQEMPLSMAKHLQVVLKHMALGVGCEGHQH